MRSLDGPRKASANTLPGGGLLIGEKKNQRPKEETKIINGTGHNLLKYFGGRMSIEMEIPKVLWLKNNMPADLFARCKFYDLPDALTHIATGRETRSFCSTVCKQGYVPVGVDGSVKGWQEDFLKEIGLEVLAQDNYRKIGGVNGEVCDDCHPQVVSEGYS